LPRLHDDFFFLNTLMVKAWLEEAVIMQAATIRFP
jgi:hypothetical protein